MTPAYDRLTGREPPALVHNSQRVSKAVIIFQ
jgi:hypothetical protein